MSSQTVVPRSGSISRSRPFRSTSSTYITFTPETLLFAAANYRQSKDVEVHNNGNSSIMFKMKTTSAEIYRVRPVYFILKSKEKRTIKVTFKGLPSEQARCQRDRLTAVMAFSMSDSNDVKMLWEKHRKIAHQPNTSSRKYIKIDFEDERRMSMARGVTKTTEPKTEISRLTSAYPCPTEDVPPPSLPRPSAKVANSGGRDASLTHPNSTKKEQAIRAPPVHPSDLRPARETPPPLERLEPSLRTSIPLPPRRVVPTGEENEVEDCRPPSIKSKIPMKTPSRRLPVPPPAEEWKEDTEEMPPPPVHNKSKMLPVKTPPPRKPPVVSPSQQNSIIEDETSNHSDVPSLPQMDIPSTTPSGRTAVADEVSTQQSIVYILYPAEEKSRKVGEEEKSRKVGEEEKSRKVGDEEKSRNVGDEEKSKQEEEEGKSKEDGEENDEEAKQ